MAIDEKVTMILDEGHVGHTFRVLHINDIGIEDAAPERALAERISGRVSLIKRPKGERGDCGEIRVLHSYGGIRNGASFEVRILPDGEEELVYDGASAISRSHPEYNRLNKELSDTDAQ